MTKLHKGLKTTQIGYNIRKIMNKKVRKFGNLLQNAQENSAYTDK